MLRIADYDTALKLDANAAGSLYGRGIAKIKKGNETEGNADIKSAQALDPNITKRFSGYGI